MGIFLNEVESETEFALYTGIYEYAIPPLLYGTGITAHCFQLVKKRLKGMATIDTPIIPVAKLQQQLHIYGILYYCISSYGAKIAIPGMCPMTFKLIQLYAMIFKLICDFMVFY